MAAEPEPTSQCTFETPIGQCRLAWSPAGITRLCLPDDLAEPAPAVLSPPQEAPAFVAVTLGCLERYFRGARESFDAVPLDLSGLSQARCTLYNALRRIGWGETTTYGGLAEMMGMPGAAQAVGQAMGKNPIPVIIPCHRVLAAGNRMGGFSAPGGIRTKQHLLDLEGVQLEETRQMGFGF